MPNSILTTLTIPGKYLRTTINSNNELVYIFDFYQEIDEDDQEILDETLNYEYVSINYQLTVASDVCQQISTVVSESEVDQSKLVVL